MTEVTPQSGKEQLNRRSSLRQLPENLLSGQCRRHLAWWFVPDMSNVAMHTVEHFSRVVFYFIGSYILLSYFVAFGSVDTEGYNLEKNAGICTF